MTRPRSQLIASERTPYYHCIARCVRRAFLCGQDPYSGQNFDHRRGWLLARIQRLEQVFAINVAAYAVMSNHYHLVLHIDTAQSQQWTMDEVIHRWLRLYKGPLLIQQYVANMPLGNVELETVKNIAQIWRQRLTSISWFMANLNEYLARQANQEDHCKGRFWEGRFKSQALLDEAALLSCMTYVDLNPIRAGLANSLTESSFTSIQQRMQQLQQPASPKNQQTSFNLKKKPRLMPFSNTIRKTPSNAAIPFNLQDYIALVEWTRNHIRPDKRGYIVNTTPTALTALSLSPQQWQHLALKVQKQSVLMLHGLNWLAAVERRQATQKMA